MRQGKSSANKPSRRRATTPEAREDQLIASAVDLAEQQLLDGTASPSVIVHFLKLGSIKEQAQLEQTREKTKLLQAKTESLKSQKLQEELFAEAIKAMGIYSGHGVSKEEDEEDEE